VFPLGAGTVGAGTVVDSGKGVLLALSKPLVQSPHNHTAAVQVGGLETEQSVVHKGCTLVAWFFCTTLG
jgi:hypothetical protein